MNANVFLNACAFVFYTAFFAVVLLVGQPSGRSWAEGVAIGGNVSITTSTGDRNVEATGDDTRAEECIAAVAGKDVRIAGHVTIKGNGGTGCRCDGAECSGHERHSSEAGEKKKK